MLGQGQHLCLLKLVLPLIIKLSAKSHPGQAEPVPHGNTHLSFPQAVKGLGESAPVEELQSPLQDPGNPFPQEVLGL